MINDYENFSRLDHGSFKAFAAAARTLNFTLAAERAAMTQSGISQHIAKLEQQLETQLFARVNRKVSLTKAGELLLKFIERHKEQTDFLIDEIHGETNRVSGKVRYGMPYSCLFTPHFSLLLNKRRTFGEVDLEVHLCPNDIIFEKLLNQKIDFGFVTRKEPSPAIRSDFFCREEYVLVGNSKAQIKFATQDVLLGSKFVSFPGMDILFDIWVKHHFRTKPIHYESLKIAGFIESLHGAITMVEHGVGITVIPKHCVEDHLRKKILCEISGPNKSPLLNNVSIVTLNEVELPRRVHVMINAFREMKKGASV